MNANLRQSLVHHLEKWIKDDSIKNQLIDDEDIWPEIEIADIMASACEAIIDGMAVQAHTEAAIVQGMEEDRIAKN